MFDKPIYLECDLCGDAVDNPTENLHPCNSHELPHCIECHNKHINYDDYIIDKGKLKKI